MKASTQHSSRGFTLIELMIVVVIATILISIAVPLYSSQVRQSRRTEARQAILDLAGREERYFSTNGASYTTSATALGYSGLGASYPVGTGYYYLSVCSPACAPSTVATTPSFSVTATPVAGLSQASDTQCTSFTVDSIGQQYAGGSGGASYCWSN
jgi:type IV pilus assembly protein PilE